MRFLGNPESWKSFAPALNWPRAPSCPWTKDQRNLEVLAWANQNLPDNAWAQRVTWDGTVQDGTVQNWTGQGLFTQWTKQTVVHFRRGRVVKLRNPSQFTSHTGHRRGVGYYLF